MNLNHSLTPAFCKIHFDLNFHTFNQILINNVSKWCRFTWS